MEQMPNIDIRYSDEQLICFNKPAWLLTHASKHAKNETNLVQLASFQLKHRLYPIHRLDRQTSGLVLLSKSSTFVSSMQKIWSKQSLTKSYITYVYGHPPQTFSSSKDLKNKKTGESRPAKTDFSVIKYFEKGALIEALPRTGRQHQIRRHLSHLGHHILGDRTYGKGKINQWAIENGLTRMFLHAQKLSFTHPLSFEKIEISSSLPTELQTFLNKLTPL